ncbi:hypothetical protein NPS74_24800, partial [Cutibacterium acnes subsp. acnes]|nr:hypothetical protein [Cutibacterium acnes subsp. acnes]
APELSLPSTCSPSTPCFALMVDNAPPTPAADASTGPGAPSLGPRLATGAVAEQVQARDAAALRRRDGSTSFPAGV